TRAQLLTSGSINLGSPVHLRVLRPQDQSALARIESIVSQAEIHRPRIAGLADQLAGYFVAILISLAVGTYLYWWFLDADQAFWIALSVLVVGCPCALSLATPTALTVLMRHLRAQGVLVQRPEALEVLPNIDRILFDKTGTLTEGRYQMINIQLVGMESESECLRIASVLESFSNHPLADVFDRPISESSYALSGWNAYAGRGVEAKINDQPYRIGTRDFVAGLTGSSLRAQIEDQGQQKIYLGTQGQLLAIFEVSDRLRPEAASALDDLRMKLPGIKLGLLSGDPSAEVGVLARKLGLHDWADSMTPEGKYQRLKFYQQQGEKVLSIGDGINDAPLLSAADASIALSNAVDLSKNKADFVLLSNSLNAIPLLVDNARRARRIISENLGWALGYNLLAIPLAMMGMIPPWLAALGMSASSAIVVLNAFRARVRSNEKQRREKIQVQVC
ncbi:MAG: heavy metal translocating P-type ATPase, partial [Pseudomonadales bacterium]